MRHTKPIALDSMHTAYGPGPAGKWCAQCTYFRRVTSYSGVQSARCDHDASNADWRACWNACGLFAGRLLERVR